LYMEWRVSGGFPPFVTPVHALLFFSIVVNIIICMYWFMNE
jgi:pyruvate/oxaloacetate carboxyltransferase